MVVRILLLGRNITSDFICFREQVGQKFNASVDTNYSSSTFFLSLNPKNKRNNFFK